MDGVPKIERTQPASLSSEPSFRAPGARRAIAGFFVSGMLLSLLGAILPSWGYHLVSKYDTVAEYFLASAVGVLISVRVGQALLQKRGVRPVLSAACVSACGAILYLAAVSPPAPAWTRMLGLLLIGVSAGLLHSAIFHAISPMYKYSPAATVNLAGTLFGFGCLVVALLISGTFDVYTVPSILILLAVIPGLFAIAYSKAKYAPPPDEAQCPIRDVVQDLRSPGAVLLTLLLFFQFGNEWAIAGWLPLFLIQRLGISPAKSLLLLAFYWLTLMVGRIVAQTILPRVPHGKLLLGSVVTAMFGCMILSVTDNRFGAMTGILFIGAGFAPIYPLVVEKIGNRFPSYHPGFYNGIFSFALTGGLLAPCILGWLAEIWDIRVVMILPLLGTVMVLLLLLAIWMDSRLLNQGNRSETAPAGPS
jgi:fucose permease